MPLTDPFSPRPPLAPALGPAFAPLEGAVDAAATWARLREDGPAWMANTADGVVVGPLTALPAPTSWADVERLAGAVTGEHTSTGTGPRDEQGPMARPAFSAPATVGVLHYEAGRWAQPVATLATTGPDAWFGRCEGAWLFRGKGPPAWIGPRHDSPDTRHPPPPGPSLRPLPPLPAPTGGPPIWTAADRYEGAVSAVLEHIRNGDCYQVNLAREVTVENPGDPLHAWIRLAQSNPARRAMIVYTGERTVLSNSPELLLGVRESSLISIPIKGTRPGEEAALELLHSQKERAELTMIVDLVRADLANVARDGSVRAGPRRVGRVGHLWHAMQRVYAELDDGRTAVDALKALFPAGSVTGAPRVRATEIIARLEGRPRGAYCGTMGWFAADGSASWNVAIRTITFVGPPAQPERATLHFGSGIVWGSDPRREREETEWKARRLLAALCSEQGLARP